MSKIYLENSAPVKELKLTPNSTTIQAILNYSKALDVKKLKKNKRFLINLN